jgi:hypothetical protein
VDAMAAVEPRVAHGRGSIVPFADAGNSRAPSANCPDSNLGP